MAARTKRLILLLVVTAGIVAAVGLKAYGYQRATVISAAHSVLAPGGPQASAAAGGAGHQGAGVAKGERAAVIVATHSALVGGGLQASAAAPRRIVSLVPALTEMLFAVGAGPQVVGVSSYDVFPPDVKKLPRVGALLDPDTERILSLRPDLVITYGSQSELEAQFTRAGIRTYSYRHGGIATVLQSLRELAAISGHRDEGERAARDIEAQLDRVRSRVRGRPRPRTLLVFERQPKALREIYASGGTGFLHEMLEQAGGDNVFADISREAVQPSTETLLTRAPDVILEVRAAGLIEAKDVAAERNVWLALASLPAVRNGRIHVVSADYLVVPGPRLAQAVELIARVLHPEGFK